MKSFHMLTIIILPLAVFTACAVKGPLEKGIELNQHGNYIEAIDHFSRIIQNPYDDNELFLAFFHRAEANKSAGFFRKAFHDYYAAKIISCYLTKYDKSSGSYARGMIPGNYCNKWANDKMTEVSADISGDDRETMKKEVEVTLSEYLI